MKSDPRLVSVRFLEKMERGERSDRLRQDPGFLKLDLRDRRLVTELVFGILRQRGRLDYYIGQLSRRPLEQLDSVVVSILRCGLYQLEFLRIPPRAAVYETVELCRQLGKTSAGALVNAVLRAYARRKPDLPPGDSPQALSIVHSHPPWLVERYFRRYGAGPARTLLERNNGTPTPALWVNPFKSSVQQFCRQLQAEEIPFEIYPRLPHCLLLPTSFFHHPLYQRGDCFFMDIGSQEIALQAEIQGRAIVGDFCAAPGSKSFLLASRLRPGQALICSDIGWSRLHQMRERARLHGIPQLQLLQADLAASAPYRRCFDFILLDVPCSGLGTIRSHPEIRWRIQESDLPRFQEKQLAILSNSFLVLRRGGELNYATCSTEPEENEQVIREFVGSEKEAVVVGDFYRNFPQNHPGDCFFAARIRRV